MLFSSKIYDEYFGDNSEYSLICSLSMQISEKNQSKYRMYLMIHNVFNALYTQQSSQKFSMRPSSIEKYLT